MRFFLPLRANFIPADREDGFTDCRAPRNGETQAIMPERRESEEPCPLTEKPSAGKAKPPVPPSEERSRNMRAVKGRDTKPEMQVRRLLHRLGYRYRLHRKDLPGRPDIVFGPRRKVIFVHGCFWHGHSCKAGQRVPKTNTEYWTAKILTNVERDRRQIEKLSAAGWSALVLWECELRDSGALTERLVRFLDGGNG